MKCQKCAAENINEAVKCGICGVKLKHQTSFDHFTGNRQIKISNQEQLFKQRKKLLRFIQEKTLRAQGRYVENPLKNKKIFMYVVWMLIILMVAIIESMNSNAIY